MQNYLHIAEVMISVLLIISILLQSRGSGLGSIMGGQGNVFSARRGIEKTLFYATIILSVLFFGLALADILIFK